MKFVRFARHTSIKTPADEVSMAECEMVGMWNSKRAVVRR